MTAADFALIAMGGALEALQYVAAGLMAGLVIWGVVFGIRHGLGHFRVIAEDSGMRDYWADYDSMRDLGWGNQESHDLAESYQIGDDLDSGRRDADYRDHRDYI